MSKSNGFAIKEKAFEPVVKRQFTFCDAVNGLWIFIDCKTINCKI